MYSYGLAFSKWSVPANILVLTVRFGYVQYWHTKCVISSRTDFFRSHFVRPTPVLVRFDVLLMFSSGSIFFLGVIHSLRSWSQSLLIQFKCFLRCMVILWSKIVGGWICLYYLFISVWNYSPKNSYYGVVLKTLNEKI